MQTRRERSAACRVPRREDNRVTELFGRIDAKIGEDPAGQRFDPILDETVGDEHGLQIIAVMQRKARTSAVAHPAFGVGWQSSYLKQDKSCPSNESGMISGSALIECARQDGACAMRCAVGIQCKTRGVIKERLHRASSVFRRGNTSSSCSDINISHVSLPAIKP